MVADLTNKELLLLGANWKLLQAIKATQSDWVSFAGVKGVVPVVGIVASTAVNAMETITYGTVTINNSGSAYTATTTSIVITSGAVTRIAPLYLLSGSGEIIEVTADSDTDGAAATLTIRRGALGTIASATGLAHTNVLTILNMVYLGNAAVGGVLLAGCVMPDDPGTKMA